MTLQYHLMHPPLGKPPLGPITNGPAFHSSLLYTNLHPHLLEGSIRTRPLLRLPRSPTLSMDMNTLPDSALASLLIYLHAPSTPLPQRIRRRNFPILSHTPFIAQNSILPSHSQHSSFYSVSKHVFLRLEVHRDIVYLYPHS
jgi:hypothetical protein